MNVVGNVSRCIALFQTFGLKANNYHDSCMFDQVESTSHDLSFIKLVELYSELCKVKIVGLHLISLFNIYLLKLLIVSVNNT